MTIAQADPVTAAIPDARDNDVQGHAYAWYDPDAAAFELSDELADLDPLADDDAITVPDYR